MTRALRIALCLLGLICGALIFFIHETHVRAQGGLAWDPYTQQLQGVSGGGNPSFFYLGDANANISTAAHGLFIVGSTSTATWGFATPPGFNCSAATITFDITLSAAPVTGTTWTPQVQTAWAADNVGPVLNTAQSFGAITVPGSPYFGAAFASNHVTVSAPFNAGSLTGCSTSAGVMTWIELKEASTTITGAVSILLNYVKLSW